MSDKNKYFIDCVLRRNANLFQNLGSDSSKEEYQEAKDIERERLLKVRYLNPEKIDRLIND